MSGRLFSGYLSIKVRGKHLYRIAITLAILSGVTFGVPVSILQNTSYAHPGNTAADGCHYCWTRCDSWGEVYGERHCHGGSGTSSPSDTVEEYAPDPPEETPYSQYEDLVPYEDYTPTSTTETQSTSTGSLSTADPESSLKNEEDNESVLIYAGLGSLVIGAAAAGGYSLYKIYEDDV